MTDDGRAYGRTSGAHDPELTEVGAGTPAGELLRRYWHPVVGYNYRLTNLQAAIGLAQVEKIQDLHARHQQVAAWYQEELKGVPGLKWQQTKPWARHAWWQFVVVMDEAFAPDRDAVLAKLQSAGIDACSADRSSAHPASGGAGRRGRAASRG